MAAEPLSRDQLIALSDDELLRLCQVDRYRSSGPGGQKRNKTESAIRIRHVPTAVSAHADDQRSQHANKRKAVRRLRAKFAIELREDVDDAAAPPAALADMVRLGPPGKQQRDKPGYLTAIAHLLDRCHAADYRIGDAAKALSTNTSSIAKLVTADPRILRRVNEERAARKQKPLR